MASKATTAERARAASEPGTLVLICLIAWALPGAGHLWLGRRQKAMVFLPALLLMFVIGLLIEGRIFPLQFNEPLGTLTAVAEMGLGIPWILTRLAGAGEGTVTAATFEYGNCFLVVAGLLNF